MLSWPLLKKFLTYLKSQVGHGWSLEEIKCKIKLLRFTTFDDKLDITARISKEIFNKLDSDQKAVASLLEKV